MFTKFFIYLFFMASGFLAIAHELIWSRLLKNFLVSNLLSSAAVLVIFFGGIAIGSLLVNFIVKLFKKSESAFLSLFLFAGLNLFVGLQSQYFTNLENLFYLIPASISLGAMFPLLTDFYVSFREHNTEKKNTFSKVYSLNNFASALSVLVTIFYFIKTLGLNESIQIITKVHYGIAALAALFSLINVKKLFKELASLSFKNDFEESGEEIKFSNNLLLLSFILGFALLGLETLWIRVFELSLSGSVYSFAMLLFSVITGITLGSSAFYLLAKPLKLSTDNAYKKDFANIITLLVIAFLLIAASLFYTDKLPYLYLNLVDQFSFVLSEYAREDIYMICLHFCKFLTAGVLTVPVISLFSFIGTYIVQIHYYENHSVKRAAESVGLIFFINTLGAIIASGLFAFYLIPNFGLDLCLKAVLILLALTIIYLTLFTKYLQRSQNILILLIAIACPGFLFIYKKDFMASNIALGTDLYYGLKYKDISDFKNLKQSSEKVLFHKDGLFSTVTVIEDERANIIALKNNSKLEAAAPLKKNYFSRADMQTQYLLAMLGNFFKPNADNAFLIGMGSGISLDTLALHPNIRNIDVVELEDLVYQASDKYFKKYFEADHSKVTRYTENAKYFLLKNDKRYDLIISQPSDPWLSVEMFTDEFWQLSKERLNDDGIFVQWLQLYSLDFEHLVLVLNTMKQSYEKLLVFHPDKTGELLILASNKEFNLGYELINKKFFKDEKLKAKLNYLSIYNPADILAGVILTSTDANKLLAREKFILSLREDVNTNDNSLLEFHTAENFHNFSKTIKANLVQLSKYTDIKSTYGLFDDISEADFNILKRDLYFNLKEALKKQSSSYRKQSPEFRKLQQMNLNSDLIKKASQVYETTLNKAKEDFLNDNFEEAEKVLDNLLSLDPNIIDAYMLLAKINRARKNDDAFQRNLDVCLKLNPYHIEALYLVIDYNYNFASLAKAYTYTKRIKNIENFEDALSYSEFENLKKISKKLEDIMAIK
ncbi:MAG: fused MFS/spermidine synthase [Candidatus Caenarcaniphilales bacterium]|nr:fused MFS/spermidine synthase [Candidatus Caenarcaniphilales bacterium]